MRFIAIGVAAQLVLIPFQAVAQEKKKDKLQAVSFVHDVLPILKASCLECHNASKKKGKLDLSSYEALKRGGKSGAAFVAGDPSKSLLVSSISGQEPEMPKKKDPLLKDQVDLIARWIREGATNPQEEQGKILGKEGAGKQGSDSNGAKANEGNPRAPGVKENNDDRANRLEGEDEEGVKGPKGKRARERDDGDDDDDGVRRKNGRRNGRTEGGEDEDSGGRKSRKGRGDDD